MKKTGRKMKSGKKRKTNGSEDTGDNRPEQFPEFIRD